MDTLTSRIIGEMARNLRDFASLMFAVLQLASRPMFSLRRI